MIRDRDSDMAKFRWNFQFYAGSAREMKDQIRHYGTSRDKNWWRRKIKRNNLAIRDNPLTKGQRIYIAAQKKLFEQEKSKEWMQQN